ncbi:MAG: hypothetical protein Q8M83_05895, partial [bacterium]|nr:hypothetical protein [bacterium]
LHDETIRVSKHAICASDLLKSPQYQKAFETAFKLDSDGNNLLAVMGHSRLVTNGSQHVNKNNQPVIKSGIVGIHNGIITNVDELWCRFSDIHRQFDIDTEALLALIRKFMKEGHGSIESVCKSYQLIEGVASICLFFEDQNACVLATNNGSLYIGSNEYMHFLVFASEKYILQQLSKKKVYQKLFGDMDIHHVKAGTGKILYLKPFNIKSFSLCDNCDSEKKQAKETGKVRFIEDISPIDNQSVANHHFPGQGPYVLSKTFFDEYPTNSDLIGKLRRCTKCILPETMPFIEFDAEGVCNYCRSYKRTELKGIDALMKLVEPYRKGNGTPECLVTFSGGRDSSYGMHFVECILKLQQVTYTYDWGMVTDLARRNQMRMCGKLGIEHVLVSADITQKRSNIKKNVLAWLKSPNLGTVPLFMAGDKQYFFYANKVSRQIGCELIFLCENPLETTRFKSGFCGVPPRHGTNQTYELSLNDRATIALFYAWQYIQNPSYLNTTIIDTLWAYACYYFISHPYINLYEYIQWDEDLISSTLIESYNWETAKDTKSTWRIGDGTAAFYNYIYYTIGGLTENDT